MPKIRGFKPDLWTDEAFVEVSPFARLLWLGMWNFACDNGHLQHKPKQIKMRVLPTDNVDTDALLDELTAQGLIECDEDWITVPNLTRHQKVDRRFFMTCGKPGCSKPEAGSQRESRRAHDGDTTSARRAHDVDTTGPRGDGDVDGELMVMGKKDVTPTATIGPRPDVERICEHLADRIEGNGSKRPAITKAWRTAARLLLDKDGRPEDEVHRAIDWCQGDPFWHSVVLSMPKFRDKYDQMRLQAARNNAASTVPARSQVVEGWGAIAQQLFEEENR